MKRNGRNGKIALLWAAALTCTCVCAPLLSCASSKPSRSMWYVDPWIDSGWHYADAPALCMWCDMSAPVPGKPGWFQEAPDTCKESPVWTCDEGNEMGLQPQYFWNGAAGVPHLAWALWTCKAPPMKCPFANEHDMTRPGVW